MSWVLTSAQFFRRTLIGSIFFSIWKDFTASSKANVPYIVFLLLMSSPQESKKLRGFVSIRVDASQRSRMWLLAKLCPATLIIYFLSSSLVLGAYFLRKFIILVDPFFDAIYNGVFWSLSFASNNSFIPFFNYIWYWLWIWMSDSGTIKFCMIFNRST